MRAVEGYGRLWKAVEASLTCIGRQRHALGHECHVSRHRCGQVASLALQPPLGHES